MDPGWDPHQHVLRHHERWDDDSTGLLTAVEDACKPVSPITNTRTPLSQVTNTTPQLSSLGQEPPCVLCDSPDSTSRGSRSGQAFLHSKNDGKMMLDGSVQRILTTSGHQGRYVFSSSQAVANQGDIPAESADTLYAVVLQPHDEVGTSATTLCQQTPTCESFSPDISYATLERNTHRVLLSLAVEVCCCFRKKVLVR
jgi:hypothetical protein